MVVTPGVSRGTPLGSDRVVGSGFGPEFGTGERGDLGDACAVAGDVLEWGPHHTGRLADPMVVVGRRFHGLGHRVGTRIPAPNRRGPFGGWVENVAWSGAKTSATVTGLGLAAALRFSSGWFTVTTVASPPPESGAAPTMAVP
ncbi:MAG TPA: hypothetical protein VED84_02080 [Acidimicrobiales bacterium]|nr:hypothetical protein [Acidimicrobiales bacterium]